MHVDEVSEDNGDDEEEKDCETEGKGILTKQHWILRGRCKINIATGETSQAITPFGQKFEKVENEENSNFVISLSKKF